MAKKTRVRLRPDGLIPGKIISNEPSQEEMYGWFRHDEELWNFHINMLRNTPGNENLTDLEAEGMVDTMFNFCILVCEMVMRQEREKGVKMRPD